MSKLLRYTGVRAKLHRLKNSTSRFRERTPISKTVQNMAETNLKLHGNKNDLFIVIRLIYADIMQKKLFEIKATDLTTLCYIL